MTNSRFYSNNAVSSTLNTGINASATNVILNGTTGMPTSFPFVLSIDPDTGTEELVLVASGAGTSGSPYVVSRGFDNTSGVTHAVNAVVQHRIAAVDFTDSRTHEAAFSAIHGLDTGMFVQGGVGVTLASVINTTTETSFATFVVPAQTVAPAIYHIVCWGTTTFVTGAGLTLRARYNSGTNPAASAALTAGTTLSANWRVEGELYISSLGATGAYSLNLSYSSNLNTTTAISAANTINNYASIPATGTNDTTAPHGFQLSIQWAAATSSWIPTGGYARQIA